MKSKAHFSYLFVLLLLSGVPIRTVGQQTQKYKADLEQIKQPGFYKISLHPNLIAKSKDNLADIRIIDQDKKFIPYLKLQSLPSVKENFINFPVLENSRQGDSITTLIVENTKRLLIPSLWLSLKNTAVSRRADLLGSDDRQNWFAIDDDILLRQAAGNSSNSYFQSITFPPSNYKYFKISIHNKNKGPIQILQAGIYSNTNTAQKFIPLPPAQLSRKDSSDKSTYLQLSFKQRYQVNKLSFRVSYPKYFQRNVLVYALNGKEKTLLTNGTLSSDADHQIEFSSKTPQLQIQIANGDNPPLQIANIQAWQLDQSIVAYLEPGKSYQLLFSDKHATEPDYDLRFFSDTALKNISEIKHLGLTNNPLHKTPELEKKRDYTLALWISIVAALALLIFLSWRMMGEIKSRD